MRIILLSAAIFFISCKNDQYKPFEKELVEKEKSIINKENPIKLTTSKLEEIIDDEFIFKLIENDVTLTKIRKYYSKNEINFKLVKNIHNEKITDSLITICNSNDTIVFYKAEQNVLLQKLTITSGKIKFDNEIGIGSDKNVFLKKFKRKTLADSLIIRDTEGGNVFTFLFQNNKLSCFLYSSQYTD